MRYLVSFLITLLLSGLCYASELTIGLIPEQNVFKQIKRYKPIGEYIEKKSGIAIKFSILPRYGNIIARFEKKNLDGAFWGSFTGAMAIKKLGIQPIARPVNLDGTSSYRGYIFVRKESQIADVERMKNSVIAYVDKATTAGYVFPIAYFKEEGVQNVNTYFQEHYFTGSHDASIYAVLDKEAEIGCAKNTIYDRLAREDARIDEELVVLAQSPDVPSNALGLRRDMAPEIKERIKQVLLEMERDPEGQEVLKRFGAMRFIETTADDYSRVFDLTSQAGIDLKTYKYQND